MSSTDVLVIGSGPVGSAFARLIAESLPRTTITMVELGPVVSDPPGSNLRNLPEPIRDEARLRSQGPQGVPPGDSERPLRIEGTIVSPGGTYLPFPGHQDAMPAAALSSCVGGMGAHWTCACPEPNDDERIPFIPEDELAQAYRTAERLLHVTTLPENPYSRAILEIIGEHFGERLPEDRGPGPLPMSAFPQADGTVIWGGSDTVLGDTPVDLHADTICRRLIVVGDRVVGGEVEHLPSGRRWVIEAKVVVVAANAFQTPQLLWASDIRPPALGRYLTEHPLIISVVALSQRIVQRAGIDMPLSEIVKDPMASTFAVPYSRDAHPFRTQIMHTVHSPVPSDDPTAESGPAGYVAIGNGVPKRPRVEDGLVFSDSETDAWGMPLIDIEYELTAFEDDAIEVAKADLVGLAGALGEFVPGGEPTLMPRGTSLHFKGTVRMGDDGGAESVVDTYSRVWGFSNLFLGGNGLIPTATASNPTLTSVALASRAATAVVDELNRRA